MKKYKLIDRLCDLYLKDYEIEFSEEELKKLKNFAIFEDSINEFIVVPIGINIKTIERIVQSKNSLNYLNFYYNLLKKIINNNNEKLKYIKFTKNGIIILNLLRDPDFFANTLVIKEHLIKYVNNFVIKNNRIPNANEVKEELIRFLNSYNIIEQIEMYLNKSKLLNII
ncbi:MAG: hypothetical protein QXI77_02225 [Nanopusillaceae archaeon]